MNGFYGGFNFSGNPSCGFDAGAFNNGLNQYLESVKAQLMQQYAPPLQQQNPYAAIDARVENYMTPAAPAGTATRGGVSCHAGAAAKPYAAGDNGDL